VVNWHRFVPADFEYDFDEDKLAAHGVTFEEAVACFFSDFEVRRNKSYRDRYQLIGTASGGRKLKIIFQLTAVQLRAGVGPERSVTAAGAVVSTADAVALAVAPVEVFPALSKAQTR